MKKSYVLKTFVVIFVLLFCICLTSCTEYGDDVLYNEWEMSEGAGTLVRYTPTGDTLTYLYLGYTSDSFLMGDLYYFQNGVFVDGYYADILSCAKDSPILFVSTEYDILVYAQSGASGTDGILAFLDGEYARYTVADFSSYREGVFNDTELRTFFDTVPTEDELVSFDVRELEDALRYEILGYDQTRVLSHTIGAVYEMDGELYFVNYDELDNSYFSADGTFSYRRGTVELALLTGERLQTLKKVAARNSKIADSLEYEDGYYVESEEPTDAEVDATVRTGVIVATVILGLILPLLPIGYVVLYLLTRKRRRAVCDLGPERVSYSLYVMLGGGALWFLSALTLLLIVIFG